MVKESALIGCRETKVSKPEEEMLHWPAVKKFVERTFFPAFGPKCFCKVEAKIGS